MPSPVQKIVFNLDFMKAVEHLALRYLAAGDIAWTNDGKSLRDMFSAFSNDPDRLMLDFVSWAKVTLQREVEKAALERERELAALAEFAPISPMLREIGKTDCLFCQKLATRSAVKGVAEMRCCDSEVCGKHATELAKKTAEMIDRVRVRR